MEFQNQNFFEEMNKENYYNDIFMQSYNSCSVNTSSTYYNGWQQQAECSQLMTPPGETYQSSFSYQEPINMLTPPLDEELKVKPMSKWKLKQERERLTLPLHVRQKRRLDANARERKRMTNLNNAFARLKAVLPQQRYDETGDKEMSKIETLQLAQAYIQQLADMLN